MRFGFSFPLPFRMRGYASWNAQRRERAAAKAPGFRRPGARFSHEAERFVFFMIFAGILLLLLGGR